MAVNKKRRSAQDEISSAHTKKSRTNTKDTQAKSSKASKKQETSTAPKDEKWHPLGLRGVLTNKLVDMVCDYVSALLSHPLRVPIGASSAHSTYGGRYKQYLISTPLLTKPPAQCQRQGKHRERFPQ
jgi:hypothetical protein